ARHVERDARARGAAGPFPLLLNRAAAVALRDRVVADQRAVGVAHLPAAEPEIELGRRRDRLAREYARPDAAEHAREARLGAQRVELGRLLEQRERADAEMIRRV